MSPLRQSLESYLKIRRLLGAKLTSTAYELGRFITFLEEERAPYITTSLALRWLRKSDHIQAAVANQRLGMIRVFATWLHASDPRTEIPPQGLLPGYFRRTRPYIYRDEEVVQILEATRELRPRDGLRPLTYATLFGLLAVTGMRSTEAVSLDREDVDMVAGILTVRESKFGKTRWLPLHESTREVLRAYASRRDQFVPAPRDAGFFLSDTGTRILGCSARYTFAMISQAIGLRQRTPSTKNGRNHGHGPRLHDLRHRFAVRTLVDWYRDGRDVERELPKLATYLGHVHVSDTYWYLEAVPELLQLATERLMEKRRERPS
jgi:integrase